MSEQRMEIGAIQGRALFWPDGDMRRDLLAALAEVDRLSADLATAEKEMHRFERLNGRLAGDLADAQRRIDAALAEWPDSEGKVRVADVRAALSAGGAGPTEGDEP